MADPDRLARRQPALDNLLIVGGGELAESGAPAGPAVRTGARQRTLAGHSSDEPQRICAEPIGARCASGTPTTATGSATRAPAARRFIAVESFLRREEPVLPGVRLPIGWHVTSDSIAARLAEVCQAQELVLLKSTSLRRMDRQSPPRKRPPATGG